MLQDDRNNYIASIYLKGKKAGLCFADVSTGTAHITELAADKIAPAVITELCRFHPSEVLMNPGLLDCREVTAYIKKNMTCSVVTGPRPPAWPKTVWYGLPWRHCWSICTTHRSRAWSA